MAILGIDEVGRGSWAGPLVVGACILPQPHPDWVNDLTDSKQLTPERRVELSKLILDCAAVATGWVSANELDRVGLATALKLATRRAVKNLRKSYPTARFSEIIIDGTSNFLSGTRLTSRVTVLKKADLLIKEVSAASIVAKVARDNYMINLEDKFPGYGFKKHKGYGTAAHRAALSKFGPCPEHRYSVRPLHNASLTTAKGKRAETIVAYHLMRRGHQVIARNHRTSRYEIDLVTVKDDTIYFTEVKYRQSSDRGAPVEAITAEKLSRMRFAAQSFMAYALVMSTHNHLADLNPCLAVATVSGPRFHVDDWFVLQD